MPRRFLRIIQSLCLFEIFLMRGAAHAEEQIQFKTEMCFANMSPIGICPVVITVQNRGGALNGELLVAPQTGESAVRQYSYPLPLPTGSTKRVIVYPNLQGYGGLSIHYRSGFRDWDTVLPFNGQRDGGRQVGFIGDRAGGLVVRGARAITNGGRIYNAQPMNDCYCKPEFAPDRAAGYSALASLIVGEGAERLTGVQWQAIRQWVLRGGTLVLVGGANAAYLRAPELTPILPIATATGGSLPRLSGNSLPVGTDEIPAGALAVTTGEPAEGASVACRAADGRALLVVRPRGTGKVVYVAFDPMEKPLRGWDRIGTLWEWILRAGAPTVDRQGINEIVQQKQSAFDQDESRGFVSMPRGRTPRTTVVNPFRVTLPDIGIIIWLFLGYFILAVPVTFFTLRRLQKQELAWVTTPVLAVLFSFGLYLFTADLYKAGLSRRTGGVILAAAGEPEARFSGFTEIFFPTGGSYKIAIPNAETLETRDQDDYMYSRSGQQPRAPLETVDTGAVVAPDYPVSNLSFRRLTHTQKLDFGGGVVSNIRRTDIGFAGMVTNGTPFTLRGTIVYTKYGMGQTARYYLGEIKPGETKPLAGIPNELEAQAGASVSLANMGNLMLARNSALLAADTDGERTGPALGRSVGGERSVTVLVSLPIAVK